jgi:triphosphoribosyl-dephospho-CoA synthetase
MTRQDAGSHSLRVTRGVDAATARLSRVVLALASPPPSSEASRRAKGVPGQTENLVLEFDEAYTAWVEGFTVLPEEAQLIALQRVDRQLAEMVAAKDAGLWTEQAHREAGAWHEVRALAGAVVELFEWRPVGRVDDAAADEGTS